MSVFEYKVVPAPTKGTKAKGIKTPEARFSLSIEGLLNELAADGWEYQRAETLPSTERAGIASTTTEWRNILIFRRPVPDQEQEAQADPVPELLPAPEAVATATVVSLGGVTRQEEAPSETAAPTVVALEPVSDASSDEHHDSGTSADSHVDVEADSVDEDAGGDAAHDLEEVLKKD